MSSMYSQGPAFHLYNAVRKWFMLTSLATAPITFIINAPFGRFTPKSDSIFLFDGIKSWITMELVAPTCFFYTLISSPLSAQAPPLANLFTFSPRTLLVVLFFVHYANRALISPLRTPSRSKSHIIVPFSGVMFNVANGSLMGSYLSSPYTRFFLNPGSTWTRNTFYVGISLWALGFVGNVVHDEILLNIRRKAQIGKGKNGNDTTDSDEEKPKGEHYAIPHGLLFKYVSYPNYLCEWIEWFGFALAAAPVPFSLSTLSHFSIPVLKSLPSIISSIIQEPAYLFAPSLSPPWIFLFTEIILMLPRAYKGHQWYHSKFGSSYPSERRAVVPFVF